jgi:hypothetical protein
MQISNQINDVINNLAKYFGVAADQLSGYITQIFAMFVKQSYVVGIEKLIWAGIFFIVLIFSIVRVSVNIKKLRIEMQKTGDEPTDIMTFWFVVLFVALAIVSIIVIGCTVSSAVTNFINPEYWAADHLLNMAKSAMQNNNN